MNLPVPPLSSRDLFDLADFDLVCRVRAGERGAFEPLMRRYNQRLFRLSRSLCGNDADAMDVLQDAYVAAFRKIDQFSGPDGFVGWLSRIVRNEALMRIRRAKLVDIRSGQAHEAVAADRDQPSSALARNQLAALLEQAVDQLPGNYASVYVLRAVQQLSTRETAESLELPVDVVKTRYSRAKKMLRAQLQRHIQAAGLEIYEFAGERCDAIVSNVMARIGADDSCGR